MVRLVLQGKPPALVGQRIENKELAEGRRISQNDSQCSMAETKEKQEGNHHHAQQKMRNLKQSATLDNGDRAIYWAVKDLLNLDSTPSWNWLLTTGKMVQFWHYAKIHYNRTTGCLAKVHSTSDSMKNIMTHPQKNKTETAASIVAKSYPLAVRIHRYGSLIEINTFTPSPFIINVQGWILSAHTSFILYYFLFREVLPKYTDYNDFFTHVWA